MAVLETILVPVDFSERCVGALQHAKALAAHAGAKIILVHSLQTVYIAGGGAEPAEAIAGQLQTHLAEALEQRLARFGDQNLAGMASRTALLRGGAAEEIVRFAHTERVSLIVMPTHGYGPFRRFVLGSTTAKVLHDADCPVYTGVHVSEPSAAPPAFRNILCAVDFGPQSAKVLAWAAAFARDYRASLHMVHALPPLEHGEARYIDAGHRADLETRARESAGALQGEAGTQAAVHLDHGEPSKVVRAAVGRTGADLVVIGRHVGTGLLGRLRPHAYSIVRESPCPVVSV